MAAAAWGVGPGAEDRRGGHQQDGLRGEAAVEKEWVASLGCCISDSCGDADLKWVGTLGVQLETDFTCLKTHFRYGSPYR